MPREKRYEETTDARRGEAYSVRPEFARTGVAQGDVMRGRVVFVPKHRRYAVIEFLGPGGVSREAFWPEDLKARCRR